MRNEYGTSDGLMHITNRTLWYCIRNDIPEVTSPLYIISPTCEHAACLDYHGRLAPMFTGCLPSPYQSPLPHYCQNWLPSVHKHITNTAFLTRFCHWRYLTWYKVMKILYTNLEMFSGCTLLLTSAQCHTTDRTSHHLYITRSHKKKPLLRCIFYYELEVLT